MDVHVFVLFVSDYEIMEIISLSLQSLLLCRISRFSSISYSIPQSYIVFGSNPNLRPQKF